MSKREPTVVVTEADWQATRGVVARLPTTASMPEIAQAIAHARTMAAFDERVRAVGMVLIGASWSAAVPGLSLLCRVGDREVVRWLRDVPRDANKDFAPTADDIRALVLKGWGQ